MTGGSFGAEAALLAGLAARALGWAPATFWAATPAELAAALAPADAAPPALTRAELARLMEHDDDHD